MSRALILGCGYAGLALTRALRAEGIEVIGTTRSPVRFRELREAGATPILADVMDPSTLRPLVEDPPDVVFDLVRPQKLDEARYTAWGTRNVQRAFANVPLDAIVYLSSTAVYGDMGDELTTEDTPARPTSPVGRARLEAERIYLDAHASTGIPVRICRVPRIYGPGRTLRERVETGAYRRVDDAESAISRIHVDDLATGLIAAWRRGQPGRIYLICDDEPATAQEYAELTASILAVPVPPAVDRQDIRHEMSDDHTERRLTYRRCDNRRLREELGVELIYPTIREGIPASLRVEGIA